MAGNLLLIRANHVHVVQSLRFARRVMMSALGGQELVAVVMLRADVSVKLKGRYLVVASG